MEFSFYVPTRIIMGEGCIRKNAALLAGLGKKAFIVTSPSSAGNGSLEDLTEALALAGIDHTVSDKATPNPDLPLVGSMGREARANGCDFVIGLGGGSAMDAAKAASVLASNDMPPEGVYGIFKNRPLPVAAVPTTCGTGSEVTPVSVLTYEGNKKSFKSDDVIPRIAFLDARYIENLPVTIARDTAVDALSHAAEGYLMADNWMSDMFAEKVFAFFGQCRDALAAGGIPFEIRERLLFMAMAAGLVISMTGTAAVHAMGYPLTTRRDVPHGRACGVLLGEYVEFCLPARSEKIGDMLRLLGMKDVTDLKQTLAGLLNNKDLYTPEELEKYTEISYASAIGRANPVKMEKSDVLALYKRSLL